MSLFLILLAGGDGNRLKSNRPKPYNLINGKTILEYSIDAFSDFKEIKKILLVFNYRHKKYLNKIKLKKGIIKVNGGKSRQESVFNALKRVRKLKCNKVLIHDTARPNISKKLIKKTLKALKKRHAVIPVLNPSDAIKISNGNLLSENIKKNSAYLVQTPQAFTFKKIYEKHIKYKKKLFDDDSSLLIQDGEKVSTLNGEKNNLKITTNEDLKTFIALKNSATYYGIGFDIHKLVKNKNLYLGGVKILFPYGLEGHSDGDPVLHAIIDSLLGACGLGDIGNLFSDKNKKYKKIRSTILLRKVVKLIKSKKFLINNIDINIITEKPKIKKYKNKMINLISKICEIEKNKINIKGKTVEKLGIIGKEQAIASEVISSVIKND